MPLLKNNGRRLLSSAMKFFKHGYTVRGTQKDINSRLKAILEAGFAVRGDINSRWKAILDAGYAVHGRRKFKMESCLRGML